MYNIQNEILTIEGQLKEIEDILCYMNNRYTKLKNKLHSLKNTQNTQNTQNDTFNNVERSSSLSPSPRHASP